MFHVDFNGSNFLDEGVLEKRLYAYVRDWERQYGLVSDADSLDLGGRFMEVLRVAHEQTGRRVSWMFWIQIPVLKTDTVTS